MILKFTQYIKESYLDWVEEDGIKIDIYDTKHSAYRKYYKNNSITDDVIVGMVQDSLDILKKDIELGRIKVDDKFVIENKDIHLVCLLNKKMINIYNLIIITVMQDDPKEHRYFMRGNNQYVIDLDMVMSYLSRQGGKKYFDVDY